MTRVFCVGIATLDYVYRMDEIPTRPEKHRASDLVVVGGGIAANAAVAVSRLGGQAMLATRLGDDFTAQEIVAELEAEGVDCRLCRRLPGRRSPVSAILVDARGERLVVSYADRSYPADTDWLPRELPAGTEAVLGDTRWEEGAAHVFALARHAGIPAVFDADRAPRHHQMLALASHVAFSAQGLRELTGLDDPRRGLESLAAGAANWLAVTVGVEGVYFLEDGTVRHEPAFAVKAVDTLGAGDVWHGALALALGEGRRGREAVRFASAAAAIKATRFGGRQGAPTRAEVEAFLAENG
ncbi:PfkB family carbohydrate kinase [Chelatococcus sp. SYSU_G07232]|uniref:PfkB family carbohydrate kinase n=1 Tax=Chelatococcus albus TaxID=3047466 RepID=A0ABT7AHZ0_9HYPH|nr:PfkB family carbohydrate kinase [Chelatococcus sp. SYSU_G07232]MDJ1159001.1 PfkB family carbohydrate kinase [Chelatococcus sp. SYSU_G07232]